MTTNLMAIGRIVWGHPGNPRIKRDDNGNEVTRDGQPVQQWSFGLAVPKLATIQSQGGDPSQSFEHAVWPYLEAEAKTGFPNGAPSNFSWKFKDADTSVDGSGNPLSSKPGQAGCYILAISTEAFAPPLFRFNGQTYSQMNPDELKTGDYVAVNLSAKLNIPTNKTYKPGIYLNPQGICFVGYGDAIVSAPDAKTMFGGQQFALPVGASATPVAPVGALGMPGTSVPTPISTPAPVAAPAPAPVAPQAPAPVAEAPQAPVAVQQPAAPVAPAHDFVQNAVAPGAIPGSMPPR